MSATPWADAVAYYESRIADGDSDAMVLQRLAEWVRRSDLADLSEVKTREDSLAITPAGRPYADDRPFVEVWAEDDWPRYQAALKQAEGGRALASWVGSTRSGKW